MIFPTIIISVILLTVVLLGMSVQILSKKKRFPQTSIGKNKHMAKRGIYCVKCEEMKKCKLN